MSLSRVIPGAAGRLDPLIGRLRRGGSDPTHRRTPGVWWRASVTPGGGVLLRLRDVGADVEAVAWGSGAGWALDQAPRLLGCHDDPAGFAPTAEPLRTLHRRHPELRVGATDLVAEALLPCVIEQKVTGAEAFRAITWLTRRHGEPAPGPAQTPGHPAHGLRLPLTAAQWAAIPSWEYLRAGVEQKRSATLVGAARRATAIERTLAEPASADVRLRSLPGIGVWTSARARQSAHGDPDAWSDGDYHVPGMIARLLLGHDASAADATEALRPYEGHRYRVEQLLGYAHFATERHGPRRSLPTHLPAVTLP